MSTPNPKAEVLFQTYEARLKSHDWWYERSDDRRSRKAGKASWDMLVVLRRRAREENEEREGVLWDTYCPYKKAV